MNFRRFTSTNIVKDEKGNLATDSHNTWLGGGTVSLSCSLYMELDVRQTEIHTAETLVLYPRVSLTWLLKW